LLSKTVSLPGEQELNDQLATNYLAFKAAMAALDSADNTDAKTQVYQRDIVPGVLKMDSLLENIRDLNNRAILATSQTFNTSTAM